jgi:hypothetical protein
MRVFVSSMMGVAGLVACGITGGDAGDEISQEVGAGYGSDVFYDNFNALNPGPVIGQNGWLIQPPEEIKKAAWSAWRVASARRPGSPRSTRSRCSRTDAPGDSVGPTRRGVAAADTAPCACGTAAPHPTAP